MIGAAGQVAGRPLRPRAASAVTCPVVPLKLAADHPQMLQPMCGIPRKIIGLSN